MKTASAVTRFNGCFTCACAPGTFQSSIGQWSCSPCPAYTAAVGSRLVMSNDTCRSVTARARRPHQEERQKWPRRGATKSANESAAPSSMKRARKGTATKPIQIPSSSEGGKHSSDDSESEGASSSDVALAGFHYSSGYSHDSYPSSDM